MNYSIPQRRSRRSNQDVPPTTTSAPRDPLADYLMSAACDASVKQYLNAALAPNTLNAYAQDLAHFMAWGGTIPASPELLARYVAQHAAKLATTTISRHLVAIARAHAAQGLPTPTTSPLVRATLQGVRRSRLHKVRQVAPLLQRDIVAMVRGLKGVQGIRDTALLLVGFAGAFRRSELVALDVEDVQWADEGMILHLRRSKTDQVGRGRAVAIPAVRGRFCPCRALRRWLEVAKLERGPLFRPLNRYQHVLDKRLSSQCVAKIIKRRASDIGLDPSVLSGHSLRAGFVTDAAQRGASTTRIRDQTGHQSDAMLQRYIRNSQLFQNNPNLSIWQPKQSSGRRKG